MALDIRTLSNGITYEWVGNTLLDWLVVKSIDYNNLMENHKQYASLLGFAQVKSLNPDQTYSSKLPEGGIKPITETGLKNRRTMQFGPKKKLLSTEFWDEYTVSYLMKEWSRTAQNLSGASEWVQADMATTAKQAVSLINGYDITLAEELLRTITLWFNVVNVIIIITKHYCFIF